jgi:hypothetical protein
LSSGVASSAVGVEDLLSISNIRGKGGLDSKSESDGSSGGNLKITNEEENMLVDCSSVILPENWRQHHAERSQHNILPS